MEGLEVLKWDSEGEFVQEGAKLLKSMRANETVNNIIKASLKEFSMAAEIDGVTRKCCADVLLDGENACHIYDVKSIDGILTPHELERYCANWEIHIQGAWYSEIAEKVMGKPVRFGVIFVGKNAPYPFHLMLLAPEALELGRKQIAKYIEKLKLGLEGKWTFAEKMKNNLVLHLPDWYVTKAEAQIGGF